MAVQIPAFATDQQYPFWQLRKMMSAFATAGVVSPATDFIVSPSSGLQVQVTAGAAFVQQTVNIEGSSAYNGLYYVINDAVANPFNTIAAPTVNPRIDQVILKVYDVQEQGLGGASKGQIEWLPGTENASASLATMGPGLSNPGATALPANSLRLAYVLQTVGEVVVSSGNVLNVVTSSRGSWQPLALNAGWTTYNPGPSFYTPSARIIGDIVQLRGAAGTTPGTNPASLPSSAFSPASTVRLPQAAGGFMTITAGSTAITLGASQAPAYFDGLSYSLI